MSLTVSSNCSNIVPWDYTAGYYVTSIIIMYFSHVLGVEKVGLDLTVSSIGKIYLCYGCKKE